MSYIPKPGSIPARAIAWLEENYPNGDRVPGIVICAQLGVRPTAFPNCMMPARREGFVKAEMLERDGRLQWHMGLGNPMGEVPDSRIAARVLQYLRKQPPGTQVNTQDLADAIAVSLQSVQNMRKKLKPAMRARFRMQSVQGHGPILFWSLAEFDPIEPDEEAEDMPPRRHAPEIQPRPGPFLPGINVGMGAQWVTPVQIGAGA